MLSRYRLYKDVTMKMNFFWKHINISFHISILHTSIDTLGILL